MDHDTLEDFDAGAEPAYIVEPYQGGVRIQKYENPNEGGVNLFTLDQIVAALEERLPKGISVLVGGDL